MFMKVNRRKVFEKKDKNKIVFLVKYKMRDISMVEFWVHIPKVGGSSPPPASIKNKWGYSSIGRAMDSKSMCWGFESPYLHH